MKWPATWTDLTQNEIRKAVPLVWQMKYHGHEYDHVMLIGRSLLNLFGHKKLTDKQVIEGLQQLAWMYNTDIAHRPFEYVKVAGKKRYLPLENFADTDGIELALANMYYLMFATAAQEDATADAYQFLWLFLAMICREKVTKMVSLTDWIRVRVPLDNMKAESIAGKFAELPIGDCLAILNYWETQNKTFLDQYSNVLKGSDGEPLFKNGEGWIAALEDVAKDGVHGDMDKVSYTNCHSIWTYLSHEKTIADAQIAAAKNNK